MKECDKLKKTTMFKQILNEKHTNYIMESHNAMSGKLVEEAGFRGIWGSGLTIAASMGVRDNNEASWTEVADIVEHICDATNIPILLDADTGYGNFNNARILTRKLEKIGVAAVSIEDKLFPKTNSYIDSEQQPLASIEEFCGKIRAIKDSQADPDFCMVARIESFITGHGLGESLKRAEAYYNAGADALFIHSKKTVPEDIINFMNEWKDTCPVIIAPTTYWETPTEVFEELGVSIVIWANIMMRASMKHMHKIAKKVNCDCSLANVIEEIVPVQEIFRLQNVEELKEAERKYFPRRS